MATQITYYLKDKPYKILLQSQVKIGDEWIPCIVYMGLYENEEGNIWVRTTKDFFEKFKPRAGKSIKRADIEMSEEA